MVLRKKVRLMLRLPDWVFVVSHRFYRFVESSGDSLKIWKDYGDSLRSIWRLQEIDLDVEAARRVYDIVGHKIDLGPPN